MSTVKAPIIVKIASFLPFFHVFFFRNTAPNLGPGFGHGHVKNSQVGNMAIFFSRWPSKWPFFAKKWPFRAFSWPVGLKHGNAGVRKIESLSTQILSRYGV